MNEKKVLKTMYKVFGVVGPISSISAIPFSQIPFIGMFAFSPAILGVVFCFISMYNLKKYKEYKSSLFLFQKTGIAVGVVALVFSVMQFYNYGPFFILKSQVENVVHEEIKETLKDEAIKTIKEKIIPSSVDGTTHSSENNSIGATSTIEASNTSDDFLFIYVDRLRIRSTPDLNGETLGHLDFGTRVMDLKEQSEHKEQIAIGGEKRNEYWKKIKFQKDDYTDPIVGWVFGGGTLRHSDNYTEITDSEYLKTISGISAQEISKMLGIELSDHYDFSGIITYEEWFEKNGKFYLKGIAQPDEDLGGYRDVVFHKGTFAYGKPHGLFEKKVVGYETHDHIKIKFERGKCVWFSMNRNAEGEEYTNEESNPKDCSFDYIESGLKLQK